MRLRYAGTCRVCAAPLPASTEAVYERDSRTVRCLHCGPASPPAVPTEAPTWDSGTAGASARREHARRRDAREERIRTAHPRLGGLILALTDDPHSTRAWERGAIGEELVAARLGDLPETFRVLHDRRIPGTRANIDHVAVGPSGVWVIDAKRYKGKRPSLHVEGGIIRPRRESLRIDGRDRTTLVAGVSSQVARVTAALDGIDAPVIGALCFVEADWPLIGGSFTVDGIHVLWPRLLIDRMTKPATASIDVDAAFGRIADTFRAA